MDFSQAQKILKNLGGVISKNSPHILTGLGSAGVFSTAILTGRATLKANKIIIEEKEYRDSQIDCDSYSQVKYNKPESISKKEVIQLTWKVFIPPLLMGATSIACIIGANTINTNRTAAIAALYSLSETALREYKEKVAEEIGFNKERRIHDSITKDYITEHPVGDRTIILTGNGEVLCYDILSDRYFKSSPEKIRQQVLDFNYDLMGETWLDLNDLYYAVGLRSNKLGSQCGFPSSKGKVTLIEGSHLTPEGIPCYVFEVKVYPIDQKYL